MHDLLSPQRTVRARQSGFSLVELMVSVVVGLVIVASLAMLFANNSRARSEMEKTSQQIENGRYASQYLRDDLRLAGYFGEFSPKPLATPVSTLPLVAPDPSLVDAASLSAALPIAVQGYHFGMNSALYSTLPTGVSSLLTDRRANSDVLVVRRTSTCAAGPTVAEASCSAMDTGSNLYFQTTLCKTQLSTLDASLQFVVSTSASVFTTTNPSLGAAPTYLAQRDCTTPALTRAFYVHIYYIANNDVAGDGIPTLKMVSLGATSFSASVAIAEGIETMQIEYGLDDGTNGGAADDGAPDSWSVDPSTGANFRRVTAVKVHLLARNTQASAGSFTDTRTYVLGPTPSTDNTFGPYNDAYKRHAYSTVVRLVNIGGRLE